MTFIGHIYIYQLLLIMSYPKEVGGSLADRDLALPSLAFGKKVLASLEASLGVGSFSHSFLPPFEWQLDTTEIVLTLLLYLKQNFYKDIAGE